jgi:hypothetical protein
MRRGLVARKQWMAQSWQNFAFVNIEFACALAGST